MSQRRSLERPRGALLWDIDGTLVRWTASSSRENSHAKVIRNRYGAISWPLGSPQGMTDQQLLRALVPPPFDSCAFDPSELLEELDTTFCNSPVDSLLEIVPGTRGSLDVAADLGWKNVILTGNTRTRSARKLQAVGLADHFDWSLSGFGDQAESRIDLCRKVMMPFRQNFGDDFKLVVIGDSERDIETAKECGLLVIATRGGGLARDRLVAAGANCVLTADDSDPPRIAKFLEELSRS